MMFKQIEYSEILFKNLLRKFSRCAHDEGSTYNDIFPAQPSGKISDAGDILCQYFRKHFFYSVISNFTVLLFHSLHLFKATILISISFTK